MYESCIYLVSYFAENILELENASFSWSTDGEPFLQDLTMSVRRGDLVAVVGRVGAGKSALFSAILGEMVRCQGDLRVQKVEGFIINSIKFINFVIISDCMTNKNEYKEKEK